MREREEEKEGEQGRQEEKGEGNRKGRKRDNEKIRVYSIYMYTQM